MNLVKTILLASLPGALFLSFAFTGKDNTTLKVNTEKTQLRWFASKVTGKHEGSVKLVSGNLITDGKVLTGGNFEIDMNSITCTDLTDAATNSSFINHMKSDDFFSVAKHKTSRFEIVKVTPKGGENVEITGNMIIKGISQEITFPATVSMKGKTATARARITLDRTRWDIRFRSGKFFQDLGDKLIEDDFILELNLTAGA